MFVPRQPASELLRGHSNGLFRQIAEDVGPAVMDEVLVLVAATDQRVEVLRPPSLPAGLQRCRPFRIGLVVVANVDRGRRALEHVEAFCRFTEMWNALDSGRTGADDADVLIL